jgi:hypothetical protein
MDKAQTPMAYVALGTGYHRVEGNRRASRNGPVSDPPPEIPKVTIRNSFAPSLYVTYLLLEHAHVLVGEAPGQAQVREATALVVRLAQLLALGRAEEVGPHQSRAGGHRRLHSHSVSDPFHTRGRDGRSGSSLGIPGAVDRTALQQCENR